MKIAVAASILVAGLAAAAHAQDHENCPMASAMGHRTAVDERHQSTTHVQSAGTEHHFLLARDGGAIQLEVKDATQAENRDRIRGHLQAVARAFGEGDYSMPMSIHAEKPPGLQVMKERRSAIRYTYSPTALGGRVRIATNDATALAAVHEFLRFQIRDHETGDSAQ